MTDDIDIYDRIDQVHKLVVKGNMYDGFWIHGHFGDTLHLSASFNRLRYREYDIFFTGVTFFNLPAEWDLEQTTDDYIFRLDRRDAFQAQQPTFDPGDKHIFAFDIFYFPAGQKPHYHTYYVIADDVFAATPAPGANLPGPAYRDPCLSDPFPRFRNRLEAKHPPCAP